MRVVFLGSTGFGFKCLEAILKLVEVEIVGIVTNQATFNISYNPVGVKNVLHQDFHPFAKEHGIPVWNMQGKMTDPDLIDCVRQWKPDFLVVAGWYHMVPKAIREIAPTGGLHASLLPSYSGGAPLVWAIINGETKTGISFFLMDDGVDNGRLIAQVEEVIYPDDTIATLYQRIEQLGINLLQTYLPKIASGKVVYREQNESQRTIMPQRSPADGEIDWSWSAQRIYNFVRAQTKPYPGAFTIGQGKKWQGKKITLWEVVVMAQDLNITSGATGEFLREANGVYVRCGNNICLQVLNAEIEETEYSGMALADALGSPSVIPCIPRADLSCCPQ